MLTLFLPVIVCHEIVETFKHHSYIVPKATVGKSGLVLSVWGEHCHQMDVNKQGANSGRKRSILSIDIVKRIASEKIALLSCYIGRQSRCTATLLAATGTHTPHTRYVYTCT